MLYRALYRKWRPVNFDSVIGQQNIVTALQNQVDNNKIGHAYMFTGTRGTGKTTCAKIFSKAVNCQHLTHGNPCGECEICKGVEDGSLVDIVEIDAASNNGVDNIRDLRDATNYTPAVATYKVFIIDEVHMLSNAAFNALLKIMEEPPSHIIFILATTEIHKVPATILSRCQRYDFLRINPNEIAKRMKKIAEQEGITLQDDACDIISRLADGAMRDALSILDTCASVNTNVDSTLVRKMTGIVDKDYLFNLSSAISQKDIASAISLVAQIKVSYSDTKRLCEELITHYRNILLCSFNVDTSLIDLSQDEKYKTASELIGQNECILAIKRLGNCLERTSKGGDSQIELELALVDLCCASITSRQSVVVNNVATPPTNNPIATPAPAGKADTATTSPTAEKAVPPSTSTENKTNTAKSKVPIANWQEIVQKYAIKNPVLKEPLESSNCYIDGKNLIIETNILATSMLKNEVFSKYLKEIIFEFTGMEYIICPTEMQSSQAPQSAPKNTGIDLLKQNGVEVTEI